VLIGVGGALAGVGALAIGLAVWWWMKNKAMVKIGRDASRKTLPLPPAA